MLGNAVKHIIQRGHESDNYSFITISVSVDSSSTGWLSDSVEQPDIRTAQTIKVLKVINFFA